jgi:hypothetical protein
MSMVAPERLYLTAGGVLVQESNHTGRTVYCEPGDLISSADCLTYKTQLEAFGWIKFAGSEESHIEVQSARVRHDDATGARQIVLPARSQVVDVYVTCTEAAAGSPDMDFGEIAGDTDGLIDGLGTPNICDVLASTLEASPDFRGRGALVTNAENKDSGRIKAQKYYSSGQIFANKNNASGKAGEWIISIAYVVLPEVVG